MIYNHDALSVPFPNLCMHIRAYFSALSADFDSLCLPFHVSLRGLLCIPHIFFTNLLKQRNVFTVAGFKGSCVGFAGILTLAAFHHCS